MKSLQKKLKVITLVFAFMAVAMQNVNSAEECFENTSRAIFKFYLLVEDNFLEPIAKGFNKLPEPIKAGTNNFTSNIGTLLSFLIISYKEILNNLGTQLPALP